MRIVRNALSGFRIDHSGWPAWATQRQTVCSFGGFVMTTYDFAPLFRTAIGFDRLARLVDTAASNTEASGYPPYNIEKLGDENYRLTMAVAGFSPEELDLVVKDN